MKTSLALTRESLQELEKKEFGAVGAAINWSKWDELIAKGREEDKRLLELKHPKKKKEIYVFNLQGQLLKICKNQAETAKEFNINQASINWSLKQDVPYWIGRLYFSRENKPKVFTEQEIKRGLKKSEVYVYTVDLKTFLGKYDSPKAAADHYGIDSKTVNYYTHIERPYFKIGLYFSNKPLTVIE